jgi:polyhydroxyalkanoate synthesis regulator phasin
MTRIQKMAIGGVLVLAVSGAGAAVAATKLRSPQQESQALVNDVAGQLGVTPERLTNAFKTAMKNRIDQAVKDGRLTKAQGDRLKAEIDRQSVPMIGPGFRHPGGHGFGFRHGHEGKLDAAATYLGMTPAALRSALEDGKTLARIAKDRGKSVDGLVDALVAEKKKGIDQAVEDGHLTRAQADAFLQGLRSRVADMVNGRRPERPHFGHRFRSPPGDRPSFEIAPAPVPVPVY